MILWHENKRQISLRKHGIDLADLESVFDQPMLTVEDQRDYGELRLQSLGLWQSKVVFLVWTERDDHAHLISCRYAERQEAKAYFARVQR